MIAAGFCLALSTLANTPDSIPVQPDSIPPLRIVRRFEEFVVRSPLHDPRSSETVHTISAQSLRALPVDNLVQALALKAGAVAQGEALHVRGGRTGEVEYLLEGIPLNEPSRGRPMQLPLLALRGADLVSGGLDAEYGGALAGVVNLRTVDPGERAEGELLWQSDPAGGTRVDRVSARVSGPLGLAGLGAVASGETSLDDTHLPSLRSPGRTEILGASFGWRAQSRVLGYFKLAPVGGARRVKLELLASRRVDQPYDPMWTLDGWTTVCGDPINCATGPGFSATPRPGYARYRAADHHALTDERRLAAILSFAAVGARSRANVALGWTRMRRITSLGGRDDDSYVTPANLPLFGLYDSNLNDPFHVYLGDEPFFQRSTNEVWALRADAERSNRAGNSVRAGAGASYTEAALRELDGTTWGTGLDSLRAYHAFAPGGFAYAQTRWAYQAMIVNAGLRAEYFSAGPQAKDPATGKARALWSLSPRLGLAYPISDRDVFSLAYVRIQQDPARDFLYENRRSITNRQPLGNPALERATVISYQAAVKHLFGERWALQTAFFYRDLFGLVGARNHAPPLQASQLRYEGGDFGHAAGFEASVFRQAGETSRMELHYTYLDARGAQSLEEGVPYGVQRGLRPPAIGEHPLDWDRRHSLAFSALWQRPGSWSLSIATVAGSGLPWTPRERRAFDADLSKINTRRLPWHETTDLAARWKPATLGGRITVGVDARNLFDERGETAVTVDGYPNPIVNTTFDDYGAYRTETGRSGGAYWNDLDGDGAPGWVPVHDPRLGRPPRSVRLTVGAAW